MTLQDNPNSAREEVRQQHQSHERHIPALDGLRGLAAVIVLLSHLASVTGVGAQFFQKGGGQIGVIIFFTLSGFLMAHVYFRSPFIPPTIYGYAVARVARVVPLFLAVVVFSFALTMGGSDAFKVYTINLSGLRDHLLLRNGTSVLWTIPVELKFYALFPIFWAIFRSSSCSAAIIVTSLIVVYFSLPPGQMPIMRLGHYFLIGLGAWLTWRLFLVKSSFFWNCLFIVASTGIILSFPQPFSQLFGRPPDIWWEPQIACIVFLLLVAVGSSPLAAWILASPPLRLCGEISYSLYLTHMLTIMNLKRFMDPQAAPFLFYSLGVVLAVLQSLIIFRYFERPSRRAVRRLAAWRGHDLSPFSK